MEYEEVMWATGDTTTIPLLRKVFESGKPVGEQMNRDILNLYEKVVA